MNLTAVLFAGGESRRMGRDKAAIIVDGKPLWQRQLETMNELHPATVIISARSRPAWAPAHIETIPDLPVSRGPLSGLSAVLTTLRTTHLLALAIDLPRMTSARLNKLWFAATPGCGLCPVNHGRLEPLCAIYPIEAAGTALEMLGGEDVSLQQFARVLASRRMLRFQVVSKGEQPLFHNINTPEDLVSARAL